jgi:hypothetical protein
MSWANKWSSLINENLTLVNNKNNHTFTGVNFEISQFRWCYYNHLTPGESSPFIEQGLMRRSGVMAWSDGDCCRKCREGCPPLSPTGKLMHHNEDQTKNDYGNSSNLRYRCREGILYLLKIVVRTSGGHGGVKYWCLN